MQGTYSAYTYNAHAVAAIRNHDVSAPFFLYMACAFQAAVAQAMRMS